MEDLDVFLTSYGPPECPATTTNPVAPERGHPRGTDNFLSGMTHVSSPPADKQGDFILRARWYNTIWPSHIYPPRET